MKIVGKTIETGVVPELDGKYWGIVREGGGHGDGDVYGFVDLSKDANSVKLSNPKYCSEPTDVTYEKSPYHEILSKAKLVLIRKTTTYEVIV